MKADLGPIKTTQILREHVEGDSYRAIGKRHGIGHETARQIVIAEEKRMVGGIAYDLYAAYKAERQGRVGEWPTS